MNPPCRAKMKLDAASHLVRRPISFELFLLVYLVSALALQMVNIYKTVRLEGACLCGVH